MFMHVFTHLCFIVVLKTSVSVTKVVNDFFVFDVLLIQCTCICISVISQNHVHVSRIL